MVVLLLPRSPSQKVQLSLYFCASTVGFFFVGGVTLFVGQLSFDLDTDGLAEFFTSEGLNPTAVRIIENNEGFSRG